MALAGPSVWFFIVFGMLSPPAAAQEPDGPLEIIERTELSRWSSVGERPAPPPGPPTNLSGGAFQPLVEQIWRASPAFRQQCARLAAASGLRVTVRAELLQKRSDIRAFTSIIRDNASLTKAEINLLVPADAVELIAHEIEHVIEQLDGVEPRRDACGRHRSPTGMYETCRAIEAGRRVAREVRDAERTRMMSVRQQGFRAPLDPPSASISADGRYVAFISAARLLLRQSGTNLYVLDLDTGRLHLESRRPGWAARYSGFSKPGISADGSILVFDLPIADETRPEASRVHVLALDRTSGTVRVVGLDANASATPRHARAPVISADGSTVVFESTTIGAAAGDGPATDIYLVRLQSDLIEQVNVANSAPAGVLEAGCHMTHAMWNGTSPAVSADGRYVAFASRGDLACESGGCCYGHTTVRQAWANIYIRDTLTRITTRVTGTVQVSHDSPCDVAVSCV